MLLLSAGSDRTVEGDCQREWNWIEVMRTPLLSKAANVMLMRYMYRR
jgi:hypothetical protein